MHVHVPFEVFTYYLYESKKLQNTLIVNQVKTTFNSVKMAFPNTV